MTMRAVVCGTRFGQVYLATRLGRSRLVLLQLLHELLRGVHLAEVGQEVLQREDDPDVLPNVLFLRRGDGTAGRRDRPRQTPSERWFAA